MIMGILVQQEHNLLLKYIKLRNILHQRTGEAEARLALMQKQNESDEMVRAQRMCAMEFNSLGRKIWEWWVRFR